MKVLLAVDSSKHAEGAARSLAHLSSVDELIVLHVVDPSMMFHPIFGFEGMAEYVAQVHGQRRADGDALLARMVPIVQPHAGTVRTRLETGSEANTILETADQERADLVVMGARGAGTLEELLLGSVSHAVASRADCAVMVVRDDLGPVRRVLIPIAGTSDGERAARFLALSPLGQPDEVRVLTVLPLVDPLWPLTSGARDEIARRGIEAGNRLVEDAAQSIARLGYRTRGEVALGGPAAAILQAAREFAADMILVGARHRGAWQKFLLGSVSHGVLHGAKIPVVVVPAPEIVGRAQRLPDLAAAATAS